MNAVVFHSPTVFNPPSGFSFSKHLNLGKPIYSLRDGPIAFASQKDKIQLSVSNTKSNGSRSGRPPRKSSASRRSKDDESEKSQSFDSKLPMSPKQEEIISLFRRIQSSISKGENQRTKSTKPSNPNSSPTESILEILHQSKKPIKDGTGRRGDKALTRKRGVKKDDKIQDDTQLPVANFNLTRPPSNFVKRSPIPSPSIPRGNAIETTDNNKMLMLPKIEEMKLSELKELAKSRGLKGYSKLKKGELLELLRS
ncbi:SAP-like protein BP-73 [Manihot esculenta]|uniref:Rho termination factor-like N-terminal domain-containing protein n=1 Tax=Manihot esculenta TaxID=3983 RepID=A0A2C9U8T4_MANES|nr:SAP-like protein BP-73 [Manihot esculenta]OAY26366.1 hypothetical protein MANES_16G041900v8 [Manihot esculenta]